MDQVRDTVEPLGFGDAKIQEVDDPELGDNVVQLSVSELAPEDRSVENALDEQFGLADDVNRTSVGPTFGEQIARTAVLAVIASLLLIALYIGFRFEFKFAVPVMIALAHDLLITAGVYALFDREVTTATVAALLTIMGYSLYDTVIVFDRIRENVPRMPRATFSQIANRSMSEVFTRSLATSFVVLMPVGSLLIFGGETLKDFAFALLVGVASGAYSSIFIATPVLVEWKEREQTYMRRRRLILNEHDGHVPAFDSGVIGEPEPAVAGAAAGAAGVTAAVADTESAKPSRRERVARRARGRGTGAARPPAPPPPPEAAPASEAPAPPSDRRPLRRHRPLSRHRRPMRRRPRTSRRPTSRRSRRRPPNPRRRARPTAATPLRPIPPRVSPRAAPSRA